MTTGREPVGKTALAEGVGTTVSQRTYGDKKVAPGSPEQATVGPVPVTAQSRMGLVSAMVIVACVLMGFGDAADYGQYDAVAIILVGAGCLLVGTTLLRRYNCRAASARLGRIALETAFAVAPVSAIAFRGNLYGRGPFLYLSIALMILASGAALFLVLAGQHRTALLVCVALVSAAAMATVISSPAPRIDVWDMYQAVARGLLHLHNVYTQQWPRHFPGQATTYAYFPGSAIVLTPFYLAVGDVRYGVIAALALSGWLIGRLSRAPEAAAFGALLLLYPRLTYSVEQSWSEPLVLAALLLMVVAVGRRRTGWAVAAFAVLLTFQQYDLIFIPLAAAWKDFGARRTATAIIAAGAFVTPWALAAPRAFVRGAITYDLHYEFSYQSLSLFRDLSELATPVAYVVLVAALLTALVLTVRRVHLGGSFLLGCGVLLASFDLFDKVTRFNEWELVVGILLAAGAQALGTGAEEVPGGVLGGDGSYHNYNRMEK